MVMNNLQPPTALKRLKKYYICTYLDAYSRLVKDVIRKKLLYQNLISFRTRPRLMIVKNEGGLHGIKMPNFGQPMLYKYVGP